MRFLSLGFATIALVLVPAVALAATWSVGSGSGACYKNGQRTSGAKYCHNCKAAGGNQVSWSFTLKCDNKATTKKASASLSCGKSIPAEGDQLKQLTAKVKLPQKADCPK